VTTPLKETQGEEISQKIAFVPVMRSGLGMVDGFIYAFPNAQVLFALRRLRHAGLEERAWCALRQRTLLFGGHRSV
jgi:uracil phosphoribosyltransferase